MPVDPQIAAPATSTPTTTRVGSSRAMPGAWCSPWPTGWLTRPAPMRDEGDAYAAALEAAGVRVEHGCFAGMIHGFFEMAPVSAAARDAVAATCAMFAQVLHA